MLHNQIIAEGEASSGKYAKLKAAKNALEVLSGLAPFEFREQYGCDCVGGGDEDGDGNGNREGVDSAI